MLNKSHVLRIPGIPVSVFVYTAKDVRCVAFTLKNTRVQQPVNSKWAASAISRRTIHTSRLLRLRGPLTFDGWYPRDHKPGEYAVTEDERRAAAIKYGLRPEDYKPMNKDDVVRYAGDYPDLGSVTYDHKDPYEDWSDRLNRRNWGEMVPMDMMRHRGDRLTFTGLEYEDFTTWGSIILCLRVLVPMALLSWYFCTRDPNALRWKNPAMPKQYPYDFYRAFPYDDARRFPITNYSFDLE
ncbi:unnamed protein product [Cylicocyclus nassatus]|uniref:NADH dehydrogenase [ubiquinone] 1 beta subcomplex subunit 8, mitochondrial n=1 Tax=Cylicocyclus nassatus TaxID=53992 RepID=A0AA36HCB1_CYLNA|nr:unnamed protein product [Cylicocyclus nassatus]